MTLREKLAALRALADAATPGPWVEPHLSRDDTPCNCAYVMAGGYAGSVCTVDKDNGLKIEDGGNDSPPLEEAKANGRLIAAARTALPELAGLLEKALDVIEAAEMVRGLIAREGQAVTGHDEVVALRKSLAAFDDAAQRH